MTIDASKAPQKQKRNFVALAVRRAAPFADVDFDIAWNADGYASVWYWSRERVTGLLTGQSAKRLEFVAEPLYVGAPDTDATRLLALHSGVEGRIWKKQRLVASRWWAASPSPSDWTLFLRSAGIACDSDTALPQSEPTSIAARPWSRSSASTGSLRLASLEQYLPKAALAAGAVFLFLSLMQVGATARARVDIFQAAATTAGLDASLTRILTARENADSYLAQIHSLLALREGQSQTRLLAEAVTLMPEGQWHVRLWNQTAPDLIEVAIVSADANPEQMVAAWEASPLFTNVTTELGRDDEILIKATIVADFPDAGPGGS